MMQDISTVKVDYLCTECNEKFKVRLSDIAKEKTVKCDQGHSINLVDTVGNARKTIRDLGGKASQIFR